MSNLFPSLYTGLTNLQKKNSDRNDITGDQSLRKV